MALQTETQRHLAPRPFDFGCPCPYSRYFQLSNSSSRVEGRLLQNALLPGCLQSIKKNENSSFSFFSPMVPKIEGRHSKNFCLFLKCQPLVDEKNQLYKVNSKYTKILS
jgi:hypothetical protein